MVAGDRAVAIVKTRRSSPGRWLCTVKGACSTMMWHVREEPQL